MATNSDSGSDDAPVAVSFRDLKKNKFALSNHLKDDYIAAKKEVARKKNFRDPRFDPRVNGICVLSDWTSLKEDQENHLKVS